MSVNAAVVKESGVASVNYGGGVSSLSQLVAEKNRKMAKLEQCAKKVNGFKIAGISTLGLTAAGVAGNVMLHNKQKDLEKQIKSTEKQIIKEEDKTRELIYKSAFLESFKDVDFNTTGNMTIILKDDTEKQRTTKLKEQCKTAKGFYCYEKRNMSVENLVNWTKEEGVDLFDGDEEFRKEYEELKSQKRLPKTKIDVVSCEATKTSDCEE